MPKKTTKLNKKPLKRKEQMRTTKMKQAFLDKFVNTLGNISGTCKDIGIDRPTFYMWLKKDPEFKQMVEDVPEVRLDFAEQQLNKLIRADHPAAIIFFLKTKGKHRGYVERTEVDAQINDGRLTGDDLAEAWKIAQIKKKQKKKMNKK